MSQNKDKYKQMRVSKVQYEALGKMAKHLGVSRVQILNNAVALTKFVVDNKATAVKVVCSDEEEKEIFLSILLGGEEASE